MKKIVKSIEIKPGVFQEVYSFPLLLEELTGIKKKKWKEMNGPDSGCGLDYWYKSGKKEAYINVDQGYISVTYVDNELIYGG